MTVNVIQRLSKYVCLRCNKKSVYGTKHCADHLKEIAYEVWLETYAHNKLPSHNTAKS